MWQLRCIAKECKRPASRSALNYEAHTKFEDRQPIRSDLKRFRC